MEQPGSSPATSAVARIVEQTQRGLEATIERSVARTWAEVPAYPASPDPRLRSDLQVHTRSVFDAVLTSMAAGRRAGRDDFRLSVDQARRRVRQGVALADFMQGFRIGQETLWEAVVAVAKTDPDMRATALDLAIHVMNAIEVGSSVAAETYMAAQQTEIADDDRLRRDLMEDLLAGRPLEPGPKYDLASIAGLLDGNPVAVVIVRPAVGQSEAPDLRPAVSTVRSAFGAGATGLAVLLQDHIVGVTPVTRGDEELMRGLNRAHRSLTERSIPLSIAVSTVHDALASVPAAHREAALALRSSSGRSGVRSLQALSPLDYLTLLDDDTVLRLVRPELRAFVEDDLAAGGTQIETLRAYAACDLNAKTAAEQLHIHVNTAYYRLDRIAERTGCDLRSFEQLQDLLIAVRLLAPTRGDGANSA